MEVFFHKQNYAEDSKSTEKACSSLGRDVGVWGVGISERRRMEGKGLLLGTLQAGLVNPSCPADYVNMGRFLYIIRPQFLGCYIGIVVRVKYRKHSIKCWHLVTYFHSSSSPGTAALRKIFPDKIKEEYDSSHL